MITRSATLVCVAALALTTAGCGGKKSAAPTTSTDASGCAVVTAPTPAARTAPKPTSTLSATKTYTLTFETNCGTFVVTLDQKQSPNTAASLVSLVQKGFFNNTVFHRIVPGFVIQGGDPTQTGTSGPGYSTVDKPPATARYTHGVVAMAKTGADPAGTAGSQFFIVTAADAQLPPDYAIVGTVTKGLDVVDRIGTLGDASEQPTEVVEITKVTVGES